MTVSIPARGWAARCERVAQLGLLLYPLGCGADLTELGAEALSASLNEGLPVLSQRIQALSPTAPLLLSEVKVVPAPLLRARGAGSELLLPGGPSPATIHLQRADSETLLLITGDVRGNRVTSADPLPLAAAALVQVQAGVMPLSLGQTDLCLVDQAGDAREIYLPEIELDPGERAGFWVAADGSTYAATPGATSPEFTTLRRARLPWRLSPDVSLSQVATGFEQVSSIAFVPAPGPAASAPLFYVLERSGSVHVVQRDGRVSEYASEPELALGSGVVDPDTGDLLLTLSYSADPELPSAPHFAAIERWSSNDGGRTGATRTRLHSLEPEAEGAAPFTSPISLGPDGLLYVQLGDASQPALAQNLERSHGKILRLTRDGAAAPRNPYYDAEDGITPRDFIYASGLRAPVGGAWRSADNSLYFVEQGPGIDRFAQLVLGKNYGWNGSAESLTSAALYNWEPSVAPTSIALLQAEVFAGSGFSSEYRGRAYISQSAGS
ncbi:MAG TPA: PQQ-dependent sugar dehydrogenase, partial [Polyangiaceae bacterium]|nr:PQQ-dependent sugar dehydrogenase [Polyangiaceae bacterium]